MMPFGGKQPELGWSAHMTGGWRSQLERVRRWHRRLQQAQSAQDRSDFLYAFFENAFHLRDWLLDTGDVPGHALKELFDQNEDMRPCRDLANSHKHYSLRDPSQPHPPSRGARVLTRDR